MATGVAHSTAAAVVEGVGAVVVVTGAVMVGVEVAGLAEVVVGLGEVAVDAGGVVEVDGAGFLVATFDVPFAVAWAASAVPAQASPRATPQDRTTRQRRGTRVCVLFMAWPPVIVLSLLATRAISC